jgi:hypothetical protein
MLSGRYDKKCPHDFSRGQSGFVEPGAVKTVAVTASTNPIDSAIRFTAVSANARYRGFGSGRDGFPAFTQGRMVGRLAPVGQRRRVRRSSSWGG